MPLLKAVLLSSLWAFGLGQLEQPELSVSKATDESVYIPCKASISNFKNVDIHWYRQKSKQGFEHLMYVRTDYNQRPLGGVNKKLEAIKNFDTSTSHLKINFLKKEDEATYYCTYWDSHSVRVVRVTVTRTPPVGLGQLEQPELSISKATDESAHILYKASIYNCKNVHTHCYQQKSRQGFEQPMYTWTAQNQHPLVVNKKLAPIKTFYNISSTLKTNFFKTEDEVTYYCTYWDLHSVRVVRIAYTRTPPDKSFDGDISPKPTIFLPSVAERNLHKAGTYLCLLENFFPDVIKVYWKEKDGNTILKSQEGDTIKTHDTYMKPSWLTVTGASMDKEHKCIVKHEKNQGSTDEEILFPPVNQITIVTPREPDWKDKSVRSTSEPETCMKDENGLLDLQLTSTSAYYTYFLLLLKSGIHGALNIYCLCRRYCDCCYGKST